MTEETFPYFSVIALRLSLLLGLMLIWVHLSEVLWFGLQQQSQTKKAHKGNLWKEKEDMINEITTRKKINGTMKRPLFKPSWNKPMMSW